MATSEDLFGSYLLECMWRRSLGYHDVFEKLCECIAEQYKL